METRISKGLPGRRNILIVCEDTVSGPNYFYRLATLAKESRCWDYIEISPTPPLLREEDVGEVNSSPHKTPRRRRSLKVGIDENLAIVLEPTFVEQPVRYVRTAQKALEEGSYTEGWAVFDKDGHTGHERAAQLANEDPQVGIAFSSRSIETWFLLHFGQYDKAFEKTVCKQEDRDCLCNVANPCLSDEKGDECLLGFLRRNTPLFEYEKNSDVFPVLQENIQSAVHNAEWLRSKYNEDEPYYNRNPYTTMDTLIKRLLRQISANDSVSVGDFRMTLLSVHSAIHLSLENLHTNRSAIIQPAQFDVFPESVEPIFTGLGLFQPGEVKEMYIHLPENCTGWRIKYPAGNDFDFVQIIGK